MAFRLRNLCYVTDTLPGDAHHPFVKDARLLLVDTMFDVEDYQTARAGGEPIDHGFSRGNAELARDSGVQGLGLVHLNPSYGDERFQRLVAEAADIHPGAFVPADRQVVEM